MPSGKQTRCAAAGHAGAYQPDHHVLSRTCTGAEPPGETVWSDGRQRQSRPATRDARGNETMRGLTERQRKVLEWMKMYVRKHGRAATRIEISEPFGWADATAARSHLEALEKKGRIEILKDKYRGIRVFEAELPLVRGLGEVAAGTWPELLGDDRRNLCFALALQGSQLHVPLVDLDEALQRDLVAEPGDDDTSGSGLKTSAARIRDLER